MKNVDLTDLLPYAPQHQLAGAGSAKVPYHVVDGDSLKNLLLFKVKDVGGTEKDILFFR